MRTWAVVTGEYPPQPGGVGDYTRAVAEALAAAGDAVHVYAPPCAAPEGPGRAVVHRLPGTFGPRALVRLDRALRRLGAAHVLVQYVPHAYGARALNVALPAWLWSRRRRFSFWVVFHEVAVPWAGGLAPAQNVRAALHRAMASMAMGAARRAFVSTLGYADLLPPAPRPEWLPVPSNLPARVDEDLAARTRRALLEGRGEALVGHFGSYGHETTRGYADMLVALLEQEPGCVGVLIGRGGREEAEALRRGRPWLERRLVATGGLPADEAAAHVAACDLLLQPYSDGVCTRRGSLMAGLALGVPVVTTVGARTEPLWARSEAVALAPAGDVAGGVAAARRLLADAPMRAALGARGRALYQERFALEHTVRRLRELAG